MEHYGDTERAHFYPSNKRHGPLRHHANADKPHRRHTVSIQFPKAQQQVEEYEVRAPEKWLLWGRKERVCSDLPGDFGEVPFSD